MSIIWMIGVIYVQVRGSGGSTCSLKDVWEATERSEPSGWIRQIYYYRLPFKKEKEKTSHLSVLLISYIITIIQTMSIDLQHCDTSTTSSFLVIIVVCCCCWMEVVLTLCSSILVSGSRE